MRRREFVCLLASSAVAAVVPFPARNYFQPQTFTLYYGLPELIDDGTSRTEYLGVARADGFPAPAGLVLTWPPVETTA